MRRLRCRPVLGVRRPADLTALPQVAALRRGEALLQGLHEVDDLPARLLRRLLGDDLLALRLALEQRQHLLAVVVLVLLDVEVRRQRSDQLLGHLQLALARLGPRVRQRLQVFLGDDFVRVEHGGDRQRVLHGTDRRQVLLGAQDEAGDADLPRALHRLDQQRVRLVGPAVRDQVVGVVVVDGIDLRQVDEVLDRDRLGRARVERLQFFLGDGDVAALADLESLDDVLPGHFVAIDAADALLLDPAAVLVVQHVEAHLLGGGGRVELDRYADQSEADRPAPDRPRHGYATSFAPAMDGESALESGLSIRPGFAGSTPKYLNRRSWCCRRPRSSIRRGADPIALAITAIP